jgi:Putative threonine efflux protein
MELFITVALLHLFAVASPGPDFFLIARQSTLYGRDISIWASLGISIGILMHSFLSIAGIYVLLSLYPDFIFYMKIIASLYIASIGVRTLLVNNQIEISSLSDQKNITATKSFVMGFFTNALNPKAFLFFIMVFSLISNTNPSNETKILLGIYMAVATFIWFTLISISFSKISKGEFIKKNLPYLEKIIGVILILIALQILYLDYL